MGRLDGAPARFHHRVTDLRDSESAEFYEG
jgi:hypothetical protein